MSYFKNVLVIITLLISLQASAEPFSNIFAFGDSYTDSGNTASIPGTVARPVPFGTAPPSYYAGGRFTNGPAWVEDFAAHFGLSANPVLGGGTNYAFGGARTGPLANPPGSAFPPSLSNPTPSLLDQADEFLTQFNGSAPANALYVIFGGINDIYSDALPIAASGGDPSTILMNTANNIGTLVSNLASAGAVDFLVLNMFDLGHTPQISIVGTPSNAVTARLVTEAFNSTLDIILDNLTNNLAIDLIKFDFFAFFDSVVANPAVFGFTDTGLPCARRTSVCSNPGNFVFYDGIHPTAAFHQVLAEATINAVPEPTTFALMTLGILSLGYRRWWKSSGYRLASQASC